MTVSQYRKFKDSNNQTWNGLGWNDFVNVMTWSRKGLIVAIFFSRVASRDETNATFSLKICHRNLQTSKGQPLCRKVDAFFYTYQPFKLWSHLQMYISTKTNSKKESSRGEKKKSCSAPDHFPLFLTSSDSHFCFTHVSPKSSAKNSEILKEPKRVKYGTIKYDEQTGGEALQP